LESKQNCDQRHLSFMNIFKPTDSIVQIKLNIRVVNNEIQEVICITDIQGSLKCSYSLDYSNQITIPQMFIKKNISFSVGY